MAKMTRAQAKELAKRWAEKGLKIRKLQDARDKELKPLAERLEQEAAPIRDKYDPQIAKLTEEQKDLEKQVIGYLGLLDKPVTIDAGDAVAENTLKTGNRVIPPQTFFDFVKEKNADFWDCVTVAIGKAEKLIGKKNVDALSDKPKTIVPSLTMKQK